jgi:hypothetical protein
MIVTGRRSRGEEASLGVLMVEGEVNLLPLFIIRRIEFTDYGFQVEYIFKT